MCFIINFYLFYSICVTFGALQGEWKARRIPNPDYFEDTNPFRSMTPIAAVGFELWTVTGGVYFDNIIITSELAVANNFAYDG